MLCWVPVHHLVQMAEEVTYNRPLQASVLHLLEKTLGMDCLVAECPKTVMTQLSIIFRTALEGTPVLTRSNYAAEENACDKTHKDKNSSPW